MLSLPKCLSLWCLNIRATRKKTGWRIKIISERGAYISQPPDVGFNAKDGVASFTISTGKILYILCTRAMELYRSGVWAQTTVDSRVLNEGFFGGVMGPQMSFLY